MRLPKPLILACLLLGVAGSFIATTLEHNAVASRNSSGTYSLPSGNPVVSGTTITSTLANATLSDIGTELTNSLDRGGRGAMTAPLRLSSGSVSAPSLAFSADTNSGLYRAGSHDVRLSINGSDSQTWTTTGTTVAGTATVTGASTLTGQVSASNGALISGNLVADASNTNVGTVTNTVRFGAINSQEAVGSKRTVGGNQFGLDFYTSGAQRMSITNAGGVKIPGSTASSPGTSISGSYGGAYTFNIGTVPALDCNINTVTLTGVTVGGACNVSTDTNIGLGMADCRVSAANTVVIRVCAFAGPLVVGSANYNVRVFQP